MSMNVENGNVETNYEACPQYEAALEDHLQGILRGPEAAALTEHLQTCAGCRAALEDAAVSARLLAIAEPAPDPGAGFSRVVMARIRQELQTSEGKSIWRPVVSVAWRFAASAAFALVLLVSFELGRHSQLADGSSHRRGKSHAGDRPGSADAAGESRRSSTYDGGYQSWKTVKRAARRHCWSWWSSCWACCWAAWAITCGVNACGAGKIRRARRRATNW